MPDTLVEILFIKETRRNKDKRAKIHKSILLLYEKPSLPTNP